MDQLSEFRINVKYTSEEQGSLLTKAILARFAFIAVWASVCVTAQTKAVSTGVSVLNVEKNSAAEKGGVRNGDVFLHWRQADQEGAIASPLDFAWIERERAPRGAVTLLGQRAGSEMVWTLSASTWGVKLVPNWPGSETVSRQISELAATKKAEQLIEYCRSACADVSLPPEARSWAFLEAATWLSHSDQWRKAEGFYQSAIEAVPVAGSHERSLIQEGWAEFCRQHADWSAADRHYQEALKENKKAGPESLAIAYDLYHLAFLKFRSGDLSSAETLATQALHIRRKLCPNTLDVVRVLNYLGVFSLQNGDLDSAEDYLRQGLTLAERLNPKGREAAFACNNLGAAAEKRGELAQAERYYLRDVDISSRLNPNDYLLSYSWSNLGTIAFLRGNLMRARQYYQKALTVQQQRGIKKDIAMTLNNLALISEENKNFLEAEKLAREALTLQAEAVPNSPEFAQTLDTLGTVLRKQKRQPEAEQTLQRALLFWQQISPNSLEEAESLQHLGEVYRDIGDLGQAEKQFAAAAEIRQRLAPTDADYADSLAALADIARLQRQWSRSSVNYAKAFRVLETQSTRIGGTTESHFRFYAKYANYYSQHVSVLIQQGEKVRAFEALDRSRAKTLLLWLEAGDVHLRTGIPSSLLQRDRQIRSLIAKASDDRLRAMLTEHTQNRILLIDQRISELQSEREGVLAAIRASSPPYAALTRKQPLTTAEIQRFLDGETLLLEYSINREGAYLFALTRDRLFLFPLPAPSLIEETVRKVYALESSPDRSSREGREGYSPTATKR